MEQNNGSISSSISNTISNNISNMENSIGKESTESTSTSSEEEKEKTEEETNDVFMQTSLLNPHPKYYTDDVKHKTLTEKAKMNFKPHVDEDIKIYLQMIREENCFKNEPAWDSSQQCLMRDMIESIKEHASAMEQLQKRRVEHKQARIERDKQIKDLKEDEERFGASFMYYDKFVKENIEKRERFSEKTQTEIKNQEDLLQQIIDADSTIDLLSEIKSDMLKCIENRKPYVDYLEAVREKSPEEFQNGIHEIIDRHELLCMIREELASEQSQAIEDIQLLSKKMFKLTNERIEELMKLRNKVTELHRHYDTTKRDNLYWETLVNKVEDMTEKQIEQLGSVKSACWSLYLQICEQNNKVPVLGKNDICKQLSVIENTIIHLRKALHIAKRRQAKTLKTNKPQNKDPST